MPNDPYNPSIRIRGILGNPWAPENVDLNELEQVITLEIMITWVKTRLDRSDPYRFVWEAPRAEMEDYEAIFFRLWDRSAEGSIFRQFLLGAVVSLFDEAWASTDLAYVRPFVRLARHIRNEELAERWQKLWLDAAPDSWQELAMAGWIRCSI
jgi:hypothetical protein